MFCMLCPESEDVEDNEFQDKESEPTGESVDLEHPWLYLKDMFAIKSMNDTNVKPTCLLCAPMYKECCTIIVQFAYSCQGREKYD